jgi:hypothetical protein
MREYKVIRMNAAGNKLQEEEVMFSDFEAADKWAARKNAERPGSVVDLEDITAADESKYEY